MRYDVVLIDIDDTLFDFRQSSFEALERAFARRDVSFTWEDMPAYEVYNDRLWRAFERGEIPKPLIFTERFRLYFAERGLDIDPEAFNHDYLLYLAEGYAFMPHCRELLEALHGKCRVYVVTNGDTFAQESRIARSGLAHLFDGVFISEQLGCRKPDELRSRAILVGDSLSSDMQGGRNAGIATCYYGKAENADDRCDYVIGDLLELLPIVENG